MLLYSDDYLRVKKLRYPFTFYRDINDQRILQSDWTRDTASHTQPKVVFSDATFPCWLTPCKKKKKIHHLIFSRDIDDQRFLQSDGTSCTAGHTQLDANFHWWSPQCKKTKVLIVSFQRYWWSKNPAVWLDKRHNWSHPTTSGISDAIYLWWSSLCKKSKRLIDSLQWFWWSKITVIWLVESILGHNWKTRFFPDMRFLQNHKKHSYAPFLR